MAVVGELSAIASLIQLGASLCLSLNEYKCLKGAGEALLEVASDVQNVSSTLSQLEIALAKGKDRGIQHPPETLQTLKQVVTRCRLIFLRLKKVLAKFANYADLVKDAPAVSSRVSIRARFRWMFKEKNIEKLRQDLENQKMSLTMSLQVVSM
jgi:hypothetical protein